MFCFDSGDTRVIQNTLPGVTFNGINYYIKSDNHYPTVLYYSEDDYIDDTESAFLFINHLPKGNYVYYIYIETEQDKKAVISKMQNQLLTSGLSENTYRFLTNVIPDIQSLGNVVKLAARTVNNPIMLSTAAYEIIEMCNNDIPFDDPIWKETARTGVCSPALVEQFEAKGITEKVASKGEPVLWTFDEADMYPKITSKIMYKEELIAYISVFVVNRESVSQAFAVLKELTPVFSAILSKSARYISDRYQLTRNFIYRLLEGNLENIEEAAADLNIHLSKYRLVCVANKKQETIYNYNYYLNALLEEGVSGTFYKGKLILFIEEQEEMDTYMQFLQSRYFPGQYYLLVSETLQSLDEAARITPMMLHFSSQTFEGETIIFIRDYLHILYVPAPYLYNAAYYRLDCSANKDLKETLIQYIEHNLNAAKTAEALFIHRNTLFYRLNRISKYYGIDTANYLDLTNFYIYHLHKIKREER